MAMDDMWHRRVPEGKTWRIPIVGLVPIFDAVVGVLVALAVGAAGVLIAAVQNHLGDLGSCDVIVVAGLAVVFFLRRRLPIASAAGVTLIWIVGTYVTPYMVNNWASTLAFFFSYYSLMVWARTRRAAWGSMLGVFVVIMGWVTVVLAFGHSLSERLRAISPDSKGDEIIYLVLTYVVVNIPSWWARPSSARYRGCGPVTWPI